MLVCHLVPVDASDHLFKVSPAPTTQGLLFPPILLSLFFCSSYLLLIYYVTYFFILFIGYCWSSPLEHKPYYVLGT